MFEHQKVKLMGITKPVHQDITDMSAQDFIVYCARVSNPESQALNENNDRLFNYLIRNQHWSPFEMISLVMEIKTTRDIGRQILRHRSFSFQEFSGRYARYEDDFVTREARLQDLKNRQNSIDICNDDDIQGWWESEQIMLEFIVQDLYQEALNSGIAKEQARSILPEGMTPSTMFMQGTLRSWIHYCKLRCGNGTQKEHMDIANKAKQIIINEFPLLEDYLNDRTD